MGSEFATIRWNDQVAASARQLIRLAIVEDLDDQEDWTTTSLVPADAQATASLVARAPGIVAGMPLIQLILEQMPAAVEVTPQVSDGATIAAGQSLAQLQGNARDLLTGERIVLNFLCRLSGIATLTRQYVTAAQGEAAIYDTRKTTPGWRWLEKYAVLCGGGKNHRLGLHRAVMLKDNHVALAQEQGLTLVAALQHVARRLQQDQVQLEALEVEVDTLEQFAAVLSVQPDIVLLDNFSLSELKAAVILRNEQAPAVVLEASGGVTLATVGKIAATGVDRISVGALTHSATALDLGLDWVAG